jgi:hypothetical protein
LYRGNANTKHAHTRKFVNVKSRKPGDYCDANDQDKGFDAHDLSPSGGAVCIKNAFYRQARVSQNVRFFAVGQ